MDDIRSSPATVPQARAHHRSVGNAGEPLGWVGGQHMLYASTRVAMAQGMLMARFAMSEGYAMKYLSDQAGLHELTLVELAERVIERVIAS